MNLKLLAVALSMHLPPLTPVQTHRPWMVVARSHTLPLKLTVKPGVNRRELMDINFEEVLDGNTEDGLSDFQLYGVVRYDVRLKVYLPRKSSVVLRAVLQTPYPTYTVTAVVPVGNVNKSGTPRSHY